MSGAATVKMGSGPGEAGMVPGVSERRFEMVLYGCIGLAFLALFWRWFATQHRLSMHAISRILRLFAAESSSSGKW